MSPAQQAADMFRAVHGAAPNGVWSAPGRVNLVGEHTDYNEGFVLPFALPYRIAAAASPRADQRLTVATVGSDGRVQHADHIAIADLRPGAVTGWAAYPAGVAWVLAEQGIDGGADLVVAGDVPTGAGLSSSHALECACALALLGLVGMELGDTRPETPSADQIARWVQRAENDFVGAPTGLLDQTASLRCTDSHALFLDVRTSEAEQVPFDASAVGLELLVIDTRTKHSHSESAYGDRRDGTERAADLLGRKALRDVSTDELAAAVASLPAELGPLVRHVVTENQRVLDVVGLLKSRQLAEIGPLLNASHASMRDDYRISSVELDLAVEAATSAGALGARMTGGGFGGSAIALVHGDRASAVEATVAGAFADQRLRRPRIFAAGPSAGAHRETL